jgi:acyl-CoA thioesterase-2
MRIVLRALSTLKGRDIWLVGQGTASFSFVEEVVEELVQALLVRQVGEDRFRVVAPRLFDSDRVFGGVVVANALNAAVQTVDNSDMRPHSLHGCFLRPARPGAEFELHVERWRDGRAFATRHVTIFQADRRVMSATVSFHGDEPGDEYQLPMAADAPLPDQALPTNEWDRPFETREAGPVAAGDGTYRSTRRVWIRLPGSLPDDAALHVTLAAYVSDMTGNSFRPLSLNTWGRHTDASLDHSLWLHRPFRVDQWLFYDLQAVVNGGGRALVRGSLYDMNGRLCFSLAQELLIRELQERPDHA